MHLQKKIRAKPPKLRSDSLGELVFILGIATTKDSFANHLNVEEINYFRGNHSVKEFVWVQKTIRLFRKDATTETQSPGERREPRDVKAATQTSAPSVQPKEHNIQKARNKTIDEN